MSALRIYYDGREIGQINHWHQADRQLTVEANELGLLEGMVIELANCANDVAEDPTASAPRTGALVGQASALGVLIQLDELVVFGAQ